MTGFFQNGLKVKKIKSHKYKYLTAKSAKKFNKCFNDTDKEILNISISTF